jgi:hypothetical protein
VVAARPGSVENRWGKRFGIQELVVRLRPEHRLRRLNRRVIEYIAVRLELKECQIVNLAVDYLQRRGAAMTGFAGDVVHVAAT